MTEETEIMREEEKTPKYYQKEFEEIINSFKKHGGINSSHVKFDKGKEGEDSSIGNKKR